MYKEKIQLLKDEKNEIKLNLDTMLDNADTENRSLTEDEEKEYNKDEKKLKQSTNK